MDDLALAAHTTAAYTTRMTQTQIQALRRHLGESVATFGARFAVSGRTVESWECGRRAPSGLTARTLDECAAVAEKNVMAQQKDVDITTTPS